MAKIKCTVNHPNLHLAVAGKLQQMESGKTITVEEKHASRYLANGSLKRLDESDAVEIGDKDEGADELAALKARAAELNIEGSNRWGKSRLVEEIASAEESMAAGYAVTGASE